MTTSTPTRAEARISSRPGRVRSSLTGAYLVAAAVMFAGLLPATTAACGSPPLDGRFAWDAHDAAAFAAACGQQGLASYTHLQILDLVYPVLLATTVSVWAAWLGARLAAPRWLTGGIVIAATAGAVLDYLENVAAWVLIRTEEATSWVFTVGGAVSPLKNLTGGVAITAVVVLACWWVVTWCRARQDRT